MRNQELRGSSASEHYKLRKSAKSNQQLATSIIKRSEKSKLFRPLIFIFFIVILQLMTQISIIQKQKYLLLFANC